MNQNFLAERLFPEETLPTIATLRVLFAKDRRELSPGGSVTRFAPSPTGFLHIGNLYSAFASYLQAKQTQGVFLVRMEDTDKKREVPGARGQILQTLAACGLHPDEGFWDPTHTGNWQETGYYRPYTQSARRNYYRVYARKLVLDGVAYPCFCTEEERQKSREAQEAAGETPGYYGKHARCRGLSLEEQLELLDAGVPYVLRLRAPQNQEPVVCEDLIRGKLSFPANEQDLVLLKSDGIPTYHFAHAVDDSLMHVTHVIRGDEWLSSLPIHLQLFQLLGFQPPYYAHIAPLMKQEHGKKRKLSKRKDPEAAVSFFLEQGTPKAALQETLLTLLNSNFEAWRSEHPDESLLSFPFALEHMNASGALFDLQKLEDVSKTVIARMTAQEVYDQVLAWSCVYDKELQEWLQRDPDRAIQIFGIDRGGEKPRKDLSAWNQVRAFYAYFYEDPEPLTDPEHLRVLEAFDQTYDPTDDKETWFQKIKDLCTALGYAPEVKAYKQEPGLYLGHVGDVTGILRRAATGRDKSPDLYDILRLKYTQKLK